jgi:4-amino-4-deoxy-L-arabinose transferase-like glycosyltransferase
MTGELPVSSKLPIHGNQRGKVWLFIVVLLVFSVIIHASTLLRFPPVYIDEGWNGSRAWSFIQTGKPFSSYDAGVVENFPGYWTYFPWLFALLQALVLRPFQTPGLLPLRMLSLASGIALIYFLYVIGSTLRSRTYGLLAALLVAISWPFFASAHLARPDIFAATFGYLAIALTLSNDPPRLWRSLVSGLCVGIAFEMHPNGAIFGFVILALYLVDKGRNIIVNRQFWMFIGGTGLALLGYAAVHIFPYPQTYFDLYFKYNNIVFLFDHTPPILTFRLDKILQSIQTLFVAFFNFQPTGLISIIWLLYALVKSPTSAQKKLVILCLMVLASSVLFFKPVNFYYAIIYSPVVDLIVAWIILDFINIKSNSTIHNMIRYGLVSVLLLAMSGFVYSHIQVPITNNQVESQIRTVLRPGETILSVQTYWFGLYDHTNYSWENLIYYRRFYPNSSLAEAMKAIQPNIFIIDGNMEKYLIDEPANLIQPDDEYISRPELMNYLSEHADMIAEFDDIYYGQHRVYRIRW